MLVKTYGSAVQGVDATTITVEVNIDKGINFSLVGLPDSAVKESQQRIDAALNNTGYKIPGKKITINMAAKQLRTKPLGLLTPIQSILLIALTCYVQTKSY